MLRSAIFILFSAVFISFSPAYSQELKLQETGSGESQRLVLENKYLHAVVNPSQGGRVESFVHKASKQELTAPLGDSVPGGLLSDGVGQQNFWHSDWARGNYTAKVLEQSPDIIKVQLSSPTGAHWTGLAFQKVLTLRRDRAALQVEYTITSNDAADPRARPDLNFHQGLSGAGQVFLPSEAGVLSRPILTERESTVYDPSRGWVAYVSEKGAGLGATFDFKRVLSLRTSQSTVEKTPVTTLEWLFRKADFKPGTTEKTSLQLAVFAGLKEVAAVGERAAAELNVGKPVNGGSTVLVRLAPFQDISGKLSVYVRAMNESQSTLAFAQNVSLNADKVLEVSKPVKLSGAGNWVVQGVLQSEGAPNLTFEQPVFAPNGQGVYAMLPNEVRTPEFPDAPTWSRYKPIDFNFNSKGVVTPHREWVDKWAGGRPKVLALLPDGLDREAVEMAQRFDMDITTAFLVNDVYYVLGDAVRSLKLEAIHKNLMQTLDHDFDVMVISSHAWQVLPRPAKDKIVEKLEAGTGLVMPLRGAPPADMKEYYPMDFLGYDWATGTYTLTGDGPPILNALPYSAMPLHYHSNGSKPRMGEDGKPLGHVLLKAVWNGAERGPLTAINEVDNTRFAFAQTEGYLVPSYIKFQPHDAKETQVPPFDYWEYHYAMTARLIYWAAHKESPVTLLKVDGTADSAKIVLASTITGAAQIECTVRDKFGQVLETKIQKVPLQNSQQDISVPLVASQNKGAYIVDVSVRSDKGVLAFGGGTFPPSAVRITKLQPEKPTYEASEPATIAANLEGTLPSGTTLRGEVWDGSGRHVATAEVPAAAETKLALPLSRVIGTRYQVHATLLADGKVLDQSWAEGRIKATRDYTRYRAFFWGGIGGGAPENIIRATFDLYQKMGFNANWAGESQMTHDARFLQLFNMPYTRSTQNMRTAGGVTKEEATKKPVEEGNIIVNPKTPELFFAAGAKDGKDHNDEDLLLYSTADENRASGRDVDFSENGKRALREWLQKQNYKTIADLNREWGTDYKSFDDVVAMTETEAREHFKTKHTVAPWLDQRRYMVWGAAQLAKKITDGVRSNDPTALVGESGSQEPNVYNSDRDWWQMSRAYTGLAAYGGVQTVQQESYNPNLIRYSWSGYGKPSPLNRPGIYNLLGNYDKGVAVFASRSHIDPDFTLSEPGRSVQTVLTELKRGIGQMLVSAKPEREPVYVLDSHSSLLGAYMLGLETINKNSRYTTIQLLSDLGIQYKYISYEQLADGLLEKAGARVLFLPTSVALSQAEIVAIRNWVKGGGNVIGDMQTALMDEHGRMYDKPQLDDVFGIDRSKAQVVQAEKDASWALKDKSDQPLLAFTAIERGIEGDIKTKLSLAGAEGAVPMLYQNQFGKGIAYYFGADIMSVYGAAASNTTDAKSPAQMQYIQNLFAGLLKGAGVKPPIVVRNVNLTTGQAEERCPWIWLRYKKAGSNRFAIIERNYGVIETALPDVPVRVEFEEPGVIYDVVAGKLLGRGNSVDLTMVNSTGRVLALLPSEVIAIQAQPAGSTFAAGKDMIIPVEVTTADNNQDPRVLHMDVVRPDGEPHEFYSTDLIFKNAKGTAKIPFALNDPKGDWRVRITDVASGVFRELKLTLQ